MAIFQYDKWPEKSEEFYQEAFKGGVCKYCGEGGKDGPLALCDCSGLILARERFKRQVNGIPDPQPTRENPDRNHEPAARGDNEIF